MSKEAGQELLRIFHDSIRELTGIVYHVLGNNHETQDVLQEAYLRCLSRWKSKGRPNSLKGFVFVTVMNTARKMREKRKRFATVQVDGERASSLVSPGNPPLKVLIEKEQKEIVRHAITMLDEKEKEVLLLRISGGLTFEETARELKIPVGTAKTRMRSALRNIHRFLKKGRKENGS